MICIQVLLLILSACTNNYEEQPPRGSQEETEPGESTSDTVSVSSDEIDSTVQDGEEDTSAKTVTLTEAAKFNSIYSGEQVKNGCVITGQSQSVKLTLPQVVNLKGDLTIKNVTLYGSSTVIYANGYKLTIDSDVVSSSRNDRLTVYGGSDSSYPTSIENTDITLLGGYYKNVYGGSKTLAVSGDTNVVFGGNANIGDTNDDSSANISPCTVYGGGYNSAVSGTANVTIKDNAVAKFVSGVGTGANGAKVEKVNIRIYGGKIMNVFGGSLNADVNNLTAYITMNGGLCEAIFGGCQGKNMSGTVFINLLGGDVSRRVYTGCYNDCDVGLFNDTWKTACKVTGATTLSIGPDVKLCTKTGLSSDNDADMGVYCGSRYGSKMAGEKNILVFLDGCYDKMISYIGPSDEAWLNICESHHDEIIKK